jgi:hypothetical protein
VAGEPESSRTALVDLSFMQRFMGSWPAVAYPPQDADSRLRKPSLLERLPRVGRTEAMISSWRAGRHAARHRLTAPNAFSARIQARFEGGANNAPGARAGLAFGARRPGGGQ